MKLYMGIDQSFTSCGIVILNEHGDMVFHDVMKTTKEDDKHTRATQISDFISNAVENYKPVMVSLEGLAFGAVGNATRDLAGLQYVIIHNLRRISKMQETVFTPREVKLLATEKAKASKAEMIESLPETILNTFQASGYKKTTGLADLADAYWIARLSIKKS